MNLGRPTFPVLLLILGGAASPGFASNLGSGPPAPDVVVSGQSLNDTWMDCATSGDAPSITLYEGENLDDESKHLTFANMRVADLRDVRIAADAYDSDPDDENDKFNSLRVVTGTWQICEDINLGGECRIFKEGTYHAATLGSLAGEISSMVPLGCSGDRAGTIVISKEHLRKPDNSTKTARCLHNEEGNIANNGLVRLKWTNGKLSLVENVSHGVLWKTNTSGDNTLCFDSDAKLEIIDSSGAVLWRAGAGSHPSDTKLIVMECEVKLVHGSTTYWHSDTSCVSAQ